MKSPFEKVEDQVKQEVRQEIKPFIQPEREVEKETKTVVLSEENAYLSDIIKAQPKTLDEVEIKLSEREDPNFHRLSLPPEVKKHEDKFSFRWIFKNKRAIAEASQIRKWMFVSRIHFPDLPNHLFSTSGAIERGDNILAFTTKSLAEKMRKQPVSDSLNMVKSRIGAHKGNPNFYVPTDNTEEGQRAQVVGL